LKSVDIAVRSGADTRAILGDRPRWKTAKIALGLLLGRGGRPGGDAEAGVGRPGQRQPAAAALGLEDVVVPAVAGQLEQLSVAAQVPSPQEGQGPQSLGQLRQLSVEPQTPSPQTLSVPQAVPFVTLVPWSSQTGVPLLQLILPAWQAFSGVQSLSCWQSWQLPL
jgi:hypothetical protein